jgi:transketolase
MKTQIPPITAPLRSEVQYADLCRQIRGHVVEMSWRAKAAHLGSSLSCVEILAALYGGNLRIDPSDPAETDRDRLIFSKGHAISALYATLALFDFFPLSSLSQFGEEGGKLPEQPSPGCRPGVEVATGSLGHGLSIGVGMALAAKITGQDYRVYVVMSDGECNEGSVWEAAMMAPAQRLGNLVAIVDFNKWQATGRSEEILALSPLKDKFVAFGWNAVEVDGHNVEELLSVLNRSQQSSKPTAIIAHTVKGKGISFMEDDNNWHYRIPNDEELQAAKKELGLL